MRDNRSPALPRILAASTIVAAMAVGWATWTGGKTPNQQAALPQLPSAVAVVEPNSSPTLLPPATPEVAESTAVSANPVPLFKAAGTTTGEKLFADSPAFLNALKTRSKIEGRVTPLDRSSFAALTTVAKGDRITIPLADNESVEGSVELVVNDGKYLRVSGGLPGSNGSFMVNLSASDVNGIIQFPDTQIAYQIDPSSPTKVTLREVDRGSLVCASLPPYRPSGNEPLQASPRDPQQAVPLLNSRPGIEYILYLDFDGETVTDGAWNNGGTIVALPSSMNNAGITEAWQRISEDFAPFNINISTDVSKYNAAPPGKRMRCIVTPTNTAAPGAGGVAYINSFSLAGNGFSDTIPCWVFEHNAPKPCAEAASHEFGHTLGLIHDGRFSPQEEYYAGHNIGSTGWAPIMGVGYYQTLAQWSKGEYLSANNQEDDVAIISRPTNGFGYVSDDAGDDILNSTPLTFNGSSVSQLGLITSADDTDVYSFSTTGGSMNLTAVGGAPEPNLDIFLQLRDANGTILATSNDSNSVNASIPTRTLVAGDYFIFIRGASNGTPQTGYSNYGSIGRYTITGNITGGGNGPPIIISPGSVSGEINLPLTYTIVATNQPTSYGLTGTLPDGLNFNSGAGVISGTPTTVQTSQVVISATNAFGTKTKNLTIQITPTPPANLVPTTPDGWSDSIVISNETNTNTDSLGIESDDQVYIDFAVKNAGSLPADSNFNVDLYIDGQFRSSHEVVGPLAVGQTTTFTDIPVGILSFGPHTIGIKIDSGDSIVEISETDNEYSRNTFIILPQLPNLAFVQPSGWTNSIVISALPGNHIDDNSIVATDTVYVDVAVINSGLKPTPQQVKTEVYLDGNLMDSFTSASTMPKFVLSFKSDINMGTLAPGVHTIVVKTDTTEESAEIDETDNITSRAFTVGPANAGNLTFFRPIGWSNEVVISRIKNTHTDTPVITTADTLYVDFNVLNDGSAPVDSAWTAKVYVDGNETQSVNFTGSLPVANTSDFGSDVPIAPLSAGQHTIKVVLDSENSILESTETSENNERIRIITVVDPPNSIAGASFVGLIRGNPGTLNPFDRHGFVNVTVAKNGTFTAKLSLGKLKLSTKGVMSASGDAGFGKGGATATALLQRKGSTPIALDLRVSGETNSEQLLGDLTENGLLLANVTADRVIYSGAKNPVPPLVATPANLIGRYTIVLPPKTPAQQGMSAATFPQGFGVGTVDVLKTGVAKVTGTLADGSAFSFSSPLVTGNVWPVHATAGKSSDGSLNGLVTFRDVEATSDLDATSMKWIKLQNLKSPSYRNGWPQGILVDLIGSKYVRTKGTPAIPWLGSSTADLDVEGAGLASAKQAVLTIDAKGKITVGTSNLLKLKLKLNAKTGIYTGSFENLGRSCPINGAILDKQETSQGFFLANDQSGEVTLEKTATAPQ